MKNFSNLFSALLFAVVMNGFIGSDLQAQASAPAATPAAAGGQTLILRKIKLRPLDKRPLVLKSNERNPYAKRSEGETPVVEVGADSEEARVRRLLLALPVSGSSLGINNDLKVQMGDLTLKAGRVLPPLLADQSQNLQVVEISDRIITLEWMDVETNELTGKKMQISYDLAPKVSYQLSGQPRSTGAGVAGSSRSQPVYGVMRFEKGHAVRVTGLAAKDPHRYESEDSEQSE